MGEIVDLSRSERSTMAGEVLAGWQGPQRLLLFQLLAPGEEMVPVKEPVVTPVTVSFKRVTVKVPVAPANRPVPPVMTIFSLMVRTFDAVSVACQLQVQNNVSQLAAVTRMHTDPILVIVSTQTSTAHE